MKAISSTAKAIVASGNSTDSNQLFRVENDVIGADGCGTKAVQLYFICPLVAGGQVLHGEVFHRLDEGDGHEPIIAAPEREIYLPLRNRRTTTNGVLSFLYIACDRVYGA